MLSVSEVLNAGVGGNNTRMLLERLDADVLAQHPDLVVLMVGTNDAL
ncbi:MAG TPA: GDSL-type esterase/lipase family protein, partial [Armatimonadota bacterium]|nr:GDSL-type esterase/lipase family protein [Armatimonadota bacterium]